MDRQFPLLIISDKEENIGTSFILCSYSWLEPLTSYTISSLTQGNGNDRRNLDQCGDIINWTFDLDNRWFSHSFLPACLPFRFEGKDSVEGWKLSGDFSIFFTLYGPLVIGGGKESESEREMERKIHLDAICIRISSSTFLETCQFHSLKMIVMQWFLSLPVC